VLPGTEALGLVATDGTVTGLRIRRSGASAQSAATPADGASSADGATPAGQPGPVEDEVLAADLVVDTTGRSNRGPTWLRELGYEAPEEETIDAGTVYVSASFGRKPDDYAGIAAVVGATVENPRGGVALAVEGDEWHVTLLGMGGPEAPTDPESYVEWAAHAPNPDLYHILDGAPVVQAPHRMRIPPSIWRHYEKLQRFPGGYLVLGDAMCALNPAYAQGMTTAAVEALALRDCLARGRKDLAPRFFAAAAKIVAIPWSVSVTADLRFPHVVGKRTGAVKFLNWYIGRLHRVAARDAKAGTAFLRVANLIDPPQRLFAPGLAAKVLLRGR
jgi:hypothetical protein